MALDAHLYRDPMLILEDKQEREQRKMRGPFQETPFGEIKQGKEIVMTREESNQVEELLMVWYGWARADKFEQGYDKTSPSCRLADPSETHATSDDVDAKIDRYDAEAVNACIDVLPMMHRAAIGVHTANKAAGRAVFRNPRLTREEQHAKYQEAKMMLLPCFIKRGLVRRVAA